MGKYKVYAKISFSDEWVTHIIGETNGYSLVADEVVFLSTEDCIIEFDEIEGNPKSEITLPAGLGIAFGGPTNLIKVKRKTVNGVLELWAEGNSIFDLPQTL